MITLNAQRRKIIGKGVRALRKEGKMPAVIYGKGREPEPLSLFLHDFIRVWKEAGASSVIQIDIGGNKENVLISDVQIDPLKRLPLHADFLTVRMDQKIEAVVPIRFIGESPAVKNVGGVLVKVLHDVTVEALPADLPNEIIADISSLQSIHDRLTIANMKCPERVAIKANPDDIVALIASPQTEEEAPVTPANIADIKVVGREEKKGEDEESKEKNTD